MARRKRSSRTLEKAEIRLASIKSISPTLNIGDGLTVQDYTERIDSLRHSLEAYNMTLSTIDVLLTQIIETEKDLADYSEQILRGIAFKFGNNSHEYQMAGGTRKNDRKRIMRQNVVVPTS
ncbi:hypothetical protein H6G41_09745 [Tolypothrix sp. FACHB-123]|uniref:hypothetical protein n=1 Tax=Tolypothrix sp. FACHB-123 TaxID=2692868 RepID=UPI0016852071|nr:hypothetical protein [Tolypothrix sp. FACHB-123]MBD2354902.1 hypothetical protein [Tolypothrix sp. FACHB-123]